MAIVKEKMKEVIESQPEDASYEEILRELAFDRMVERGLADSRQGDVISDEQMTRRIRTWPRQRGQLWRDMSANESQEPTPRSGPVQLHR